MYAGVIASVIGHVLLILVLAVGLPELFPPEDKIITTNSVGVITEEQLAALSEPNLPPAREAGASATATAAAAPASDNADPADHPGAVVSPMVGTVYMQAEPGSPAFISVGASVAEGDTLLIVEAMKTMNHIPAPRAGTVKRILVDDGAAVEFGAPLVILE